ncbi:MAG: deoxyribodipyrimidine photo-lyase [Saprospiraceae bacterium]|nr:deoxyribodipyrimidine photo-lyase [Saprospiraceae bacterium]
MEEIAIVWLRRDLRLHDHAALFHALEGDYPVLPLFIFDTNILDDLQDKDDLRVNFIYNTIRSLQEELREMNSDILVRHGDPLTIWKGLIEEFNIKAVYYNRDYEPYAKKRDKSVASFLGQHKIEVIHFKDQLIFESGEVTKDDGDPYVVFTPYKKVWLEELSKLIAQNKQDQIPQFDISKKSLSRLAETSCEDLVPIKDLGFEEHEFDFPGKTAKKSLMQNYDETRDYPAKDGTSRLGVHLRFGTISIRALAEAARKLNKVFLSELIWREFYSHILDRFPQVVENSFKSKYDQIEWLNDEKDFKKWCEGKTGYPIVDAGMRQLNTTGYMHNRVRMITASFLTKHLLIDWRWGEAYFARRLLDYELASNNGGWQWAAGTGTDAAPYFRIFNPYTQQQKFDPDLKYIREWVPEFESDDYPEPIVEHKAARERCLNTYKKALDS